MQLQISIPGRYLRAINFEFTALGYMGKGEFKGLTQQMLFRGE